MATSSRGTNRTTSVSLSIRTSPRQRHPHLPPRRLQSLQDSDSEPPLSPISPGRIKRVRERWSGSGTRKFVLGLLGGVLLVAGVGVWGLMELGAGREVLRIPHREYETQTYRHLDFSHPISLRPLTKVYHVTKEFGPATMGGLGVMLTSLSIAQSESPYLDISIILPHYSYLSTSYASQITFFTNLEIPIYKRGIPSYVTLTVSLLDWTYPTPFDFLSPNSLPNNATRSIPIYLIGPGKSSPFHVAFKAKDSGDVYTAYKPLKQEWKDLWFAKGASELIAFLGFDREGLGIFDEEEIEGDDEDGDEGDAADEGDGDVEDTSLNATTAATNENRGVDIVHLHGATNAMVAYYLRELEKRDTFGLAPLAIVYTLHDSLDEVEYSNLIPNLLVFLDHPSPSLEQPPPDPLILLSPYLFGNQFFSSALGIDLSDLTTFVSQSIAERIVQGAFEFSLNDLVMPSIARKAKGGNFVGITNGIDFTEMERNPWTSTSLREWQLTFPRVGGNVSDAKSFGEEGGSGEDDLVRGGRRERVSFWEKKDAAKKVLVRNWREKFLGEDEEGERPWLLFIGRFQYNKGCQFFGPLLDYITSHPSSNARLIIMGAPNNYPLSTLQSLQSQYPHHLTLISDLPSQEKWGTIIRMSADFAFVPSFSEAFGLVAVEGLLFGMEVISTGIGGLGEFLEEGRNSYLFDLEKGGEGERDLSQAAGVTRLDLSELKDAVRGMERAVGKAFRGWNERRKGSWRRREERVRKLVGMALELKWDRERGPVEEYVRVYDRALLLRRPPTNATRNATAIEKEEISDVVVPDIAHGGHDTVSGEKVAEELLAEVGV